MSYLIFKLLFTADLCTCHLHRFVDASLVACGFEPEISTGFSLPFLWPVCMVSVSQKVHVYVLKKSTRDGSAAYFPYLCHDK